ncbi:hypothetical protein B7486_15995 [cyanobacterium TDX16]|nr:hypothetical protein B7486_15995 [cyanobacterium TDX16]
MLVPSQHMIDKNRIRISACAAILGIASFSIYTFASNATPDPAITVVAAQRFNLLNRKGEVVASISGEAAPWAQLSITIGANPMAVATLSAPEQGPLIMRLYGRDRSADAAVFLGNGNGGEISLFEPNGRAKATLGLNAKGEPSIKLVDKKGHSILELPKP